MNEQLVRKLVRETGFSEWHSQSQLLADFTELIVLECLVQIDEAIPDTNCSASGAYNTSRIAATNRVREHFGVEP